MKHLFIALVRFYQKFISPLKSPCCRFTPTCSHYAIEAFSKRGAVVGLGLTLWRIFRCSPLFKGGYDPVPPKRSKVKGQKACPEKDILFLSDKANGRR